MKAILLVLASLLVSFSAFADSGSTISVFSGRAVSNSISDEKSRAWGIEQETPTRFGIWQFGYLNEGHQHGDKRDGIYALIKAPYMLTKKVETSAAAGPYYTATTITEKDGIHYRDAYHTSLLATAGIKYLLDSHWDAQFRWSHVMFTRQNKHDADVFLFAVGYTPSW